MNVQEEITKAAVAEETSGNVWKFLAHFADDHVTYDHFQSALSSGEEAYLSTLPDKQGYKKNGKFRISALPAAWKGAKSVLKKAYEKEVSWRNVDGTLKGKSAVHSEASQCGFDVEDERASKNPLTKESALVSAQKYSRLLLKCLKTLHSLEENKTHKEIFRTHVTKIDQCCSTLSRLNEKTK